MLPGREHNKRITTVEGAGTSRSATQNVPTLYPDPVYIESGQQQVAFQGDMDSPLVTGPSVGVGLRTYAEPIPQRWGYTAPSGSRVELDSASGFETINLVHSSGSSVMIDHDGGVFISSKSSRGAGISAPQGDLYLSAQGEIILSGSSSFSIKTAGDLTLDVGGTLNIRAAAISTVTKSLDETVDGSASRSVTNDQSVVIGGISRTTVAGDSREQVSGDRRADISGKDSTLVRSDMSVDVKGDFGQKVAGDTLISAQGDTTVVSQAKTNVYGADNHIGATGSTQIHTGSSMTVRAGGDAEFASAGITHLIGQSAKVSGLSTEIVGGATAKMSAPSASVHGAIVTVATGSFQAPVPSGASGGPSLGMAEQMGAIADTTAAQAPKGAETADPEDIVDNLTSARKYPEYPGNGVRESANMANSGRYPHDKTPQAQDVFDDYSGGNYGSAAPSYIEDTVDVLPEEPRDTVRAEPGAPTLDIPPPNNPAAKISKLFTVGDLTGAPLSHPIPASKWYDVVGNHMFLAVNVLDALKQQFPGMYVVSGYRKDAGNHSTGYAADISIQGNLSLQVSAMAVFARDHLPCEQVYIERNMLGHPILHVKASQSLQSPETKTFTDPSCSSSQPGIAVETIAR